MLKQVVTLECFSYICSLAFNLLLIAHPSAKSPIQRESFDIKGVLLERVLISSISMDLPTYDEIFKGINNIFWLTGIPLDAPHKKLRFYVACLSLIITLSGEIAFFTSKISSENILELMDLAPCFCIGALSFFKGIFLAWKLNKIIVLKNSLEILYDTIFKNDSKRKLLHREIMKVHKLVKYYFGVNTALITVYNFSAPIFMTYHYLSQGKVKFMVPYAVIYPFAIDNWPAWIVAYTEQVFSGFVCILFITMSDALFCVLTSQICNNFYVISDEIKRLKNGNHIGLGEIVKQHQYILKLSEDLEDIFRLTNLFSYLVGSLEICALGFSITIGDWSHFLGYILFLVSVLLQILMMSVFGENIIRESGRVGEAAFLCEWHEINEKAKRTILIIMIRSHKHQKLTAYKFSVISYGSFTKIISTSWSYFTILKTVYKPSEVNNI
ncbi:unnamed protein product [Chilo suppressalis]|uniref:Odorant receptor n=1 Tax=Chilo suppressalis TaxID=168631 RepID=A0ABN8ATZ0_CHISP|nr:unnamed protein product [Chilo suppressalis]